MQKWLLFSDLKKMQLKCITFRWFSYFYVGLFCSIKTKFVALKTKEYETEHTESSVLRFEEQVVKEWWGTDYSSSNDRWPAGWSPDSTFCSVEVMGQCEGTQQRKRPEFNGTEQLYWGIKSKAVSVDTNWKVRQYSSWKLRHHRISIMTFV